MASQTSALPDGSTLTKPAYTDSADIAVINTNMDKIVSNINAENQALSNKDSLKMPQVATAAAAWALHTDLQRWSCFVPSSASDLPTSNGYFVESIRYSANYGVQIATRDSTSNAEMYIRRINQGSWGAWQQIALKSDIGLLKFYALTESSEEQNNKPWLVLREQYNNFASECICIGTINCAGIRTFWGYKIGNYATFIVQIYSSSINTYRVINEGGSWSYGIIQEGNFTAF